ncbi:uncharacterized protein LOC135494501 [Lineus longissimus]|uniref:uncharacterized protein LOC135489327 n=1 Tax=Lineus longissimus TaxID=88925 RepID=UPI00315D6D32
MDSGHATESDGSTVGYDEHDDDDDSVKDPDYKQGPNDDLTDSDGDSESDTVIIENSADDEAMDCNEADDHHGEKHKAKKSVPRYRDGKSDIKRQCSDLENSADSVDMDLNEAAEDHVGEALKAKVKMQFAHITVPQHSDSKSEKRNYSKSDYCLYCERRYQSKISVHYLAVHCNESDVKSALMAPVKSVERKNALLLLQNRGNFKHNAKCIELGEGEFVVSRRPSEKRDRKAHDFLPCEYCVGFFLKDSLWLHMKNCPIRPRGEQPETNCLRNARIMLEPFLRTSSTDEESEMIDDLINAMKETKSNPGIRKICFDDPLIREFAASVLSKVGEIEDQRRKDLMNIRQKVRSLGRLLKALNDGLGALRKPLTYFLSARHFKLVVKTVKQLAAESGSPQLAIVLGHYIKQANLLKISLGMREDSEEMQREARCFKEEYEAHWNNHVASVSVRKQKLLKINKSENIPSTTDLVRLKDWLSTVICKAMQRTNQSNDDLKWLSQLVLTRIVLFNKRRVSEVEELKVSDFLGRKSEKDNEEILASLDVSERVLAKRMALIEVRGKSTRSLRKVFILLSPDMVEQIEYLIKKRKIISPYVFSRPREINSPTDGCEAIRVVTSKCPMLRNPASIRTRGLRKYMATTAQIIDMSANELKMVADHMGHNVNIHTDVYRLQSSVLERAKVARVLIAMENGVINKFQGKKLDAINIEELPPPVSINDQLERGDQLESRELTCDDVDGSSPFDGEPQPSCSATAVADDQKYGSQKRKMVSTDDGMFKTKRARWSEEENGILFRYMDKYIKAKKNPPGSEIAAVAEKLGGTRTPAQIRTKMNNLVTGKQKVVLPKSTEAMRADNNKD